MIDNPTYKALNAVQEAVFVLDAKRHVLFANKVAVEIFGEGFVGSDFVHIIRHPECLKSINQVLNGQPSSAKSISIEYPVKSIFQVLVSSVENERNEMNILASLKDISDLHDAEQMRSDFVANVSHELRSPLTALAGFIETLQGPAKNDEAARERFLGLMDREASRMTRLVFDLLSLSKVEANLRVRPNGQANVAAIIKRVETTLSQQVAKERKSIEIDFLDGDATVIGNEDELTQVFQNLVENAIKYGAHDTKIHIALSRQENVPGIPGAALKVGVTDQGDGIAKHHLARLTERFYRVDTHRSRDKGGTGLGLAIAKHIINRHRGRLSIDSEVGLGSTFSVFLPMRS